MLTKEFEYYLTNQDELVRKFNGRYLVIIGNEVKGDYATEMEAYLGAVKLYEVGTFLIQHCTPGKDDYTQTFHSRAFFV